MSEDVEAFVASLPPEVRDVAEALRRVVRDLVPEAVEQQHGGWKIVGYSWDGSLSSSICAIAPHAKHVNLQFFRGTDLEDPDGLLTGTGKRARHVKLRSVSDAHRPEVAQLIREAAERARSEQG